MAIRDRLAKSVQDPKQPRPAVVAVPVVPEVQCVHRSWSAVGKIKCGCSNSPAVFTCAEPWVLAGYCVPRDPLPGKFPPDGPIVLTDGGTVLPSDDRINHFATWPLRAGESPTAWQVPVCATCPKRIDPPPHIAVLRRLGVHGNYDPDTGHCDIIHAAPNVAHWEQHMQDHCNSAPTGLRACWMSRKEMPNLREVRDATDCRLMVLNCFLGKPEIVEEAAKEFPNVKFLVVYHGSQNYLVMRSDWSRMQNKCLELSQQLTNVWYGTPEPTAPWIEFGYKRFCVWPNTMPFDSSVVPLSTIDPPRILIAGRKSLEKAHAASVLAAALIAKQRPVTITLIIKDSGVEEYKHLASSAGVKIEFQPWKSQLGFREWIRTSVSLTLHSTLTDSFNYLALDSLSQGRPVVGSQTIRYLPKEWQADPNDPADIARVAMMFLDDYDHYSAEALRIACEVRDRQRDEYHNLLERILA